MSSSFKPSLKMDERVGRLVEKHLGGHVKNICTYLSTRLYTCCFGQTIHRREGAAVHRIPFVLPRLTLSACNSKVLL